MGHTRLEEINDERLALWKDGETLEGWPSHDSEKRKAEQERLAWIPMRLEQLDLEEKLFWEKFNAAWPLSPHEESR